MKVAVTGASGFVGQAVLRILTTTDGIDLTKFDRSSHNLLDSESLKDFVESQDAIIHLAGVNRGTNRELFETNALGILGLLDAVVKFSPPTRVVFASSFQVYLPQSLYGLLKKFAEDLLVQYGLNHNIKSTILRLSNVYGPEGRPFYNSVVATFAHLIKEGQPLKINGDGSSERDYVYVEDIASAFIEAATYDQREVTKIIDICSGKQTTLNTVVEYLGKISGKKVEVEYNRNVVDNPWPTKDKNPSRAKEILGWEPETTLEEGLKKVME